MRKPTSNGKTNSPLPIYRKYILIL
uniref:Uncharacterized protein n=1 Tax=Anguilla anguilla TaxID=7936 RepID=A0A0E9V712_ANGAN